MNSPVEFLQAIRPGRPWLLTAIKEDGSLETKSFTDTKKCQSWIDYHNGDSNLYYHVNPTPDKFKPANGGRAKEVDIEAVDYLHVDIDPNSRDDLKKGVLAGNKIAILEMELHNADEKERILAFLTTNRPKMVPEPTWIISSGGGYQAIWKLKTPFQTSGDLELIKEAKLKNRQLELLFNADKCHNLDRLLRLPFTMNVPNQRKREKCRKKTMATVVNRSEISYDFEDFTSAIEKQNGGAEFTGSVDISGNIEPVMTADVLDKYFDKAGFTTHRREDVKTIMSNGKHTEKTKPDDNSRNTWLLHFCCECVRAKVPHDIIYSIITDKEWGISESVVERKSANAIHQYAIRQIRRAHEFAIDPKLEELNAHHCAIKDIGGKFRIAREYWDDAMKRHSISLQPQADFLAGYNNRSVKYLNDSGDEKSMPLGKWWLAHAERRQSDRMVFAPAGAPPEVYNLWKGFAAEDIPGDCSLFLDHIKNNICVGDEELYEYLLNWLANMVKNPDKPGHTAIVLHGDKGVGKGFFVKKCGELVGHHFLQVTNAQHLIGNFNAHLADTLLLFGDEAFYANNPKHESVLKGIVTEETLAIERKGIDLQTMPNYLHIMLASNDQHIVPASGNERRFVVYDVSSAKMQDSDYFHKIAEQWKNGGKDAFFNLLRHRDIKDWHPGKNAPNSEGLERQKKLSLTSVQAWWYEKLDRGYLRDNDDGWSGRSPGDAAFNDYKNWCGPARKFPMAMEEFRKGLAQMVMTNAKGNIHRKRFSVPNYDDLGAPKIQKWHYVFGDLDDLRAKFDKVLRVTSDWNDDEVCE